MGLSGATPDQMWTSVKNGLLQGILNVAINYTGDALHLSPLLTGVTANILGGAISGLFGIQQVDPNDPNQLVTPSNMFEGIANAFLRGLSSTMALGATGGTDPWSQASHISQIFDFSSLVRQGGLLNAIDAYASAIFQQTAIEQMVRISTTAGSSGSVKKYIEDQLAAGNYAEEFEGDYTYKYIFLPGSESLDPYSDDLNSSYIKIDDTLGHEGIYGFAFDGYASDGEYYLMTDGSLGLDSGTVETSYEGNRYVQHWYSGDVQYTNIIGADGYSGTFYSDSDYFSSMFANEGQYFSGTFIDESGSTITLQQDGSIANSQRSITQEGIGQFTASLVEGLSYAYNTVEAMKMSAGQGALTTLLSDDYKHVTGPSAASLANYVGDNAKQYLKTYYGVQDEEFSTYAHLFGDVGDKVADLYGGYLKAQEIIGTAIVDGLIDGAYLGTEIPLIWDEVGRAFQSLKVGDTTTASELMGGVGVRLFREGSRVLEIVTLGMVAAGKAIAAETTEAIGTNIVKPLSSASKLKFGSDDLVYGIYNRNFFKWQEGTGGTTLKNVIDTRFGSINNLPVPIDQYTVQVLDEAATLGRTVRFDLTYVNDLNGVLKGTAYPNAITSTELKHVYSNWDKFKNVVKFYKDGKEVKPW